MEKRHLKGEMKYMVLGVKMYKGCIINERGNRGSVTENRQNSLFFFHQNQRKTPYNNLAKRSLSDNESSTSKLC